ncbi:MAG: hypothetical protein ACTSV7_08980 [Candidatus Baldrarchaeia archaeon]
MSNEQKAKEKINQKLYIVAYWLASNNLREAVIFLKEFLREDKLVKEVLRKILKDMWSLEIEITDEMIEKLISGA